MLKKIIFQILLVFTLSNFAYSAEEPTPIIDSATNKLLGFDGISVNGITYNVRFVEGKFNNIFNIGEDLDFSNVIIPGGLPSLRDVSPNLRMLFNIEGSAYINKPSAIFDCDDNIFCTIITPISNSGPGDNFNAGITIVGTILTPRDGSRNFDKNFDTKPDKGNVFADWTKADSPTVSTPAPVYIPSLLFEIGLLD